MKKNFNTLIIALLVSVSAWAQTTVVTMKTAQTADEIYIAVAWSTASGTGKILANNTEMTNNPDYESTWNMNVTVPVPANRTIELIAEGDAQLLWLGCSYSRLTDLYLSKCSALTKLNCDGNQLTDLDLSGCTALKTLYASNQLSILPMKEISGGSIVLDVALYNGSPVSDITPDVTGNYSGGKITYALSGDGGNVGYEFSEALPSSVNGSPFSGKVYQPWIKSGAVITPFASMTTTGSSVGIYIAWEGTGCITANGTPLVNDNFIWQSVEAAASGAVALGTIGNATLTELDCYNNQLTALDLSKCTKLTSLYCSYNQLTDLDLSKCTELTTLYCDGNQLTNIDLSKCTKLTTLELSFNQLTDLDLSKCTELTTLDCSYYRLTDLDFSKCTELTTLGCSYNRLTDLNLLKCTKLEFLYADNQFIVLPKKETATGNIILTPNINFNGSPVSDITPDATGNYSGGKITYTLSGDVEIGRAHV